LDIPKETLEKLYWSDNLSASEIADKLGVSKSTVLSWMRKCGIPRRDLSDSAKLANHKLNHKNNGMRAHNEIIETLDGILDTLEDSVPTVRYESSPKEDIYVCLPLKVLESKRREQLSLTLVLSDLHLGHESHLPETYWSCVYNLSRVLRVLKKHYKITKLDIVCNGDIVSGKDVYRYQIFQNLVQRSHWQVFLAERIIKRTIEEIEKECKVNRVYLIKGTHESLESNFMLYLRKCLGNIAKYSSKSLILNVADPLGNYNVLFTHGYGGSSYYPFGFKFIRDMWKTIAEYKNIGVPIERVISGHCHWLTPDLELEGIRLSQSGGFQKWEYTINQRPSGMLLLACNGDECSVIPIRPDPATEDEERNDTSLEYKNMKYYAQMLKDHFKSYEL